MLLKSREYLPSPPEDYIYEVKLDGQRTIAETGKNRFLLYTRNLQNVTDKYPELQELRRCSKKPAIYDGEIVALENGLPSFELLQQRMSLRDTRHVAAIAEKVPVLYYVFDILELDGKSLLQTPLLKRKAILGKNLKASNCIKILPCFESREAILEKAQQFGYEGVVAKKKDSFYFPGRRTDSWIKKKFQHYENFVIGGWAEGGRSKDFGAILIGKFRGASLIYAGRVGTGFNDVNLIALMHLLERLSVKKSPFQNTPPLQKGLHWVKPVLVTEIKFKERTKAGVLRAPVFMRLRKDLQAADCITE